MPTSLAAAPIAALGGVLAGLLVIAALIYAAISQYRTSQLRIVEKRRLAEEQAAADREVARADAARRAEFSRIAFQTARTRIREDSGPLVDLAAALVPGETERWGETALLVPDAWELDHPLHLDPVGGDVSARIADAPGQRPTGDFQAALRGARPLTEAGVPYERVVDAIFAFEQPPASRFVNRDCYRVLDLAVGSGGVALTIGHTTYFDALEEAVLLECEVADAAAASNQPPKTPIRDAIGNPFDLAARTAGASVSTLVLRRAADGSAEFWLHRRRTLGMASGQTHVVPTGVFQPAVDDVPELFARDAEPWWSVVRELTEEFLGEWDADGRAVDPDAYESQQPLSGLEAARRAGTARPWLVGAGLEPLSFWLQLLTVLVIDADAFDDLVGDPPRENAEGTVIGRTRPDGSHGGLPFTQAGIDEALASPHLAPAADALLRLAWKHAADLL